MFRKNEMVTALEWLLDLFDLDEYENEDGEFIAEVQVHTDSRLTIRFRFEDEFDKLQQLAKVRKGA